jgi:hypothetical protein
MTAGEAHLHRVNWTSWPRLLLVYDLAMLAAGVPTALFAYNTVHALRSDLPHELVLSWTPTSVVVACLVVGLATNLVFLLGPLVGLCVTRWTRLRPDRQWRLVFAGVWLLSSLAVVAYVALTFFALPISLID